MGNNNIDIEHRANDEIEYLLVKMSAAKLIK